MLIACANCGRETELLGDPGIGSECACGNKITVPVRPPKQQFGVANCTNCWKRYGVVGRPSGTRFKCKACGEIITIREAGKKAPPAPLPKAPPSAADETPAEAEEIAEAAEARSSSSGSERASARGKGAGEMLELRSTLKKQKAAVEASVKEAREARAKLEEKSRSLEEKQAELARVQDELRGLQDRAKRQSDEIASLQHDIITRTEEASDLGARIEESEATARKRIEELEAAAREREERIAALDARTREVDEELARRPTREETDAFVAEKAELAKRLEEGGMKVAALRDAVAGIRGPLSEALARFEELGSEAGALGLPDFATKLSEARGEAEAAKGEAKTLATELELARKNLADARRKQEDMLRTAEEELEKLSVTESGERKGFLRGLFRKKTDSDSSARLRAVASKLKLRAAGSAAGDEEEAETYVDAESVEDIELEETEDAEETPAGAEEIEDVELASDAEAPAEDIPLEEIAEAEDVEEVEPVESVEKPKGRQRRSAKGRPARKGRKRRR